MRSTGKRAAESDATRRSLIESAVELFAARGFVVTTVQEIVENAGLTKGAFYHHFQSKDDILREIHDEFIESLLRRTYEVLAMGFDSRETLRRLMVEMLISFEEYNREVAIFFREHRYLAPESARLVRFKRDEFEQILVRLVEQGIEAGQFREVPHPRLAVFGIVGMCVWAYEWFDPSKEVSAREIAAMYADMLLDGFSELA